MNIAPKKIVLSLLVLLSTVSAFSAVPGEPPPPTPPPPPGLPIDSGIILLFIIALIYSFYILKIKKIQPK